MQSKRGIDYTTNVVIEGRCAAEGACVDET
jgi:hypothetical protein